jgi:hypothetical protein
MNEPETLASDERQPKRLPLSFTNSTVSYPFTQALSPDTSNVIR